MAGPWRHGEPRDRRWERCGRQSPSWCREETREGRREGGRWRCFVASPQPRGGLVPGNAALVVGPGTAGLPPSFLPSLPPPSLLASLPQMFLNPHVRPGWSVLLCRARSSGTRGASEEILKASAAWGAASPGCVCVWGGGSCLCLFLGIAGGFGAVRGNSNLQPSPFCATDRFGWPP